MEYILIYLHYSALRVDLGNSKFEFMNHLTFVFIFTICD